MPPIFNWTYVPRSFLTTWCLPKEKNKRNREKTLTLCIKVKLGPSQREAEVAMRLFVCMLNPLVQKNITLYCPLWWEPLLCSLLLLLLYHHKFVQRSIFYYTKWSCTFRSNFYCLIAPMTTYLKDLAQSLGRYGGLLKIRFGFKGFWMHK